MMKKRLTSFLDRIFTVSAGMKKDFEKIKTLADDCGVPEAFGYDYGFKTWRKYQPGRGEITDRPSFCEAIEMDLADLLT